MEVYGSGFILYQKVRNEEEFSESRISHMQLAKNKLAKLSENCHTAISLLECQEFHLTGCS
jgi:hypothetical protein